MRCYLQFSFWIFWISTTIVKISFSRIFSKPRKNTFESVSTILLKERKKKDIRGWRSYKEQLKETKKSRAFPTYRYCVDDFIMLSTGRIRVNILFQEGCIQHFHFLFAIVFVSFVITQNMCMSFWIGERH